MAWSPRVLLQVLLARRTAPDALDDKMAEGRVQAGRQRPTERCVQVALGLVENLGLGFLNAVAAAVVVTLLILCQLAAGGHEPVSEGRE